MLKLKLGVSLILLCSTLSAQDKGMKGEVGANLGPGGAPKLTPTLGGTNLPGAVGGGVPGMNNAVPVPGVNTGQSNAAVGNNLSRANANGATALVPGGAAAQGQGQVPQEGGALVPGARGENGAVSLKPGPQGATTLGSRPSDGAPKIGAEKGLDNAVKKLGDAGKRQADANAFSFELRQIFDLAGKAPVGAKDSAGMTVAGRALSAQETLESKIDYAQNKASDLEAPGFYQHAKEFAEEALKDSKSAASAVVDLIDGLAFQRAKTALRNVANFGYAAAEQGPQGKGKAEQAISALGGWEKFLGRSIDDGARLKEHIRSVVELASRPGAPKGQAPFKVDIVERAGRFAVVGLPAAAVAKIPAAAAVQPLSGLAKALSAPLTVGAAFGDFEGASLSARARLLFDAQVAAGRSRAHAGSVAAGYWVRNAARGLWQRAVEAFLGLLGRVFKSEVDLGRRLRSNDFGIRRLAALRKAGALNEAESAALEAWSSVPGAAAIALDLSKINAPADAVARAAGSPSLTVAQARLAFEQAAGLAEAYRGLTGDRSGLRSVAKVKAFFDAEVYGFKKEDPLPDAALALFDASEPAGLAYLAESVRRAALDRVDRLLASIARTEGLTHLAAVDLAGVEPNVRILTTRLSAADALRGLGYSVEAGGGFLRALAVSGDGSSAAAVLATGEAPRRVRPEAELVAKALVTASVDSRAARRALNQISAADPAFSGFKQLGELELNGRRYWAEHSRRRRAGRWTDEFLFRDLETRQPLFGHLQPARVAP